MPLSHNMLSMSKKCSNKHGQFQDSSEWSLNFPPRNRYILLYYPKSEKMLTHIANIKAMTHIISSLWYAGKQTWLSGWRFSMFFPVKHYISHLAISLFHRADGIRTNNYNHRGSDSSLFYERYWFVRVVSIFCLLEITIRSLLSLNFESNLPVFIYISSSADV